MSNKRYRIVYCTPSLYMPGGVERVLTLKANYFAEVLGYDITIILTDGVDKPSFFPLSEKVHVVNLNIGFEELWFKSFIWKVIHYLPKQRVFKKRLTDELFRIRPDFTVSLLRREINFISDIDDGSKKIGEIHINRAHYRNFMPNRTNPLKELFAKFWMSGLLAKVRRLDRFVVLTEYDRQAWSDVLQVSVIPNPLPFYPELVSTLQQKRIIAVGRYFDEKGYDMLLKAWSLVEKQAKGWCLDIYGDGLKSHYVQIANELGLDKNRCRLNDSIVDVQSEYLNSSFFVCSSRYEGFGMGIIEAMACGLPVVAFDCPWGPRSIIRDGEDGMLVEDGNVGLLAETMLSLINNPDLLSSLAQNARTNVQRFKMENIAKKWQLLFDEM